jgi:hypothetical protein
MSQPAMQNRPGIGVKSPLDNPGGVNYWEIIADNLTKPVGVGAASQRLITTSERSGLRTHIAMTESVSLCVLNEKLTAFLELERGIYPCGEFTDKQAPFWQEDPQHYGYDEHQLQSRSGCHGNACPSSYQSGSGPGELLLYFSKYERLAWAKLQPDGSVGIREFGPGSFRHAPFQTHTFWVTVGTTGKVTLAP